MQRLVYYASQFVGIPYIWGGDDPMRGYDCSGFVQELLASEGLDPPGDQTADSLYHHFRALDLGSGPQLGALAFYGTYERIIHVALCINRDQVIEAGGGGRACKTREDAIRHNAHIRVRPLNARGDFFTCMLPEY